MAAARTLARMSKEPGVDTPPTAWRKFWGWARGNAGFWITVCVLLILAVLFWSQVEANGGF